MPAVAQPWRVVRQTRKHHPQRKTGRRRQLRPRLFSARCSTKGPSSFRSSNARGRPQRQSRRP